MTKKPSDIFTFLCGLLAGCLGLTVIAGWYMGNTTLIQVNPAFAPMQFNTALGFVFCGAGLKLLIIKKAKTARLMGALAASLGLLTFLQYVFDINLGLDQLFMDQSIMTKTSHAGRMAPNTSLCFSLCGMALLWGEQKRAAMISMAAAALVLALAAITGYLFHAESLYGWGNLTRMAIHTATGFIIVSSGLIYHGLNKNRQKSIDAWEIIPLALAVIIGVISFFSWYSVTEISNVRNKNHFSTIVSDIEEALKTRYALYEQSLWGGLGLIYASETVEPDEWEQYVTSLNIEQNLPGINGIGYIDYVLAEDIDDYLVKVRQSGLSDFKSFPETFYPDKFIIKYIEPLSRNRAAQGLDIGFEANRRAAAERARDLGVPALTKKIELVQDSKKKPGFLLLIPVYDTKSTPETLEERRAHFTGWVYAPFIGDDFLQGLNEIGSGQVSYTVYDGNKIAPDALIFEGFSRDIETKDDYLLSKKTYLNLAGRRWTIVWHPTVDFRPVSGNLASVVVLGAGLIFATLLYLALIQLVRRKEIISDEVERQTTLLKEQDRQREKLLQQLADSNEDLERFAYVASHDLQEPLRMVKSFTGLLKQRYGEQLDETANQYLDFAHSSAGRMQDLILDLLEYSRMGTEAERLQTVDLNMVLDSVLENLQERISDSKAEVTSDELPTVKSNPVRLTRVLQNLIGNGIKYQPKSRTPKVHVTAEDQGNSWLLSIADNGIGIDEEYLKRVFEPFKRLHRQEEYAGTGMGLAICKRIIEGYGGKIWVESSKKGSTFYLTMPKTPTEQEQEDE